MSETDNKFKQRIIGALVLIALAIIFVPMLFSSKDEHSLPRVEVATPPVPTMPPVPDIEVEPVAVPEPVVDENVTTELLLESDPEFVLIEHEPPAEPQPPAEEVEPQLQPLPVEPPAVEPEPVVESKPAPAAKTDTASSKPAPVAKPEAPVKKPVTRGIDSNNLPVSWSIQLASLSSLENAQRLRDSYRAKHYTAYIRSADGVHKVLIGPLIREAEAVAMCKQLIARDKQECFVLRYQP